MIPKIIVMDKDQIWQKMLTKILYKAYCEKLKVEC